MSFVQMRRSLFILVLGVTALAACATRPPETPTVAIQSVAARPIAVSPNAARPSRECVAREVTVGLDIDVSPQGVDPFVVRARNLPIRVHLGEGPQASVEVGGSIAFRGVTRLTDGVNGTPVLHAARELALDDGLVTLAKGVAVSAPRRDGDHVLAAARLGGFDVDDVRLPCAGIAVGDPEAASDVVVEDEAASMVALAGGARVCQRPEGGGRCVKVPEGFPLARVSSRAGWMEVRAKFDDGSGVHGWARSSEVGEGAAALMGIGAMGGGCGCGARGFGIRRGPVDPREHHGDARIVAGARIVAAENGKGPWATVKREIVAPIEMTAEATHAMITSLPGLSETPGCDCDGMGTHAWVARESVIPIR